MFFVIFTALRDVWTWTSAAVVVTYPEEILRQLYKDDSAPVLSIKAHLCSFFPPVLMQMVKWFSEQGLGTERTGPADIKGVDVTDCRINSGLREFQS